MNPVFIGAVSMVWPFLIIADVAVTVFYRDWADAWTFCYPPAFCVCTFIEAVDAVIKESWVDVGLFSFYTVVMGWLWWNNDRNRRRRRRLRDKTAARIVLVGGRLKIARPVTDS